MSKAKEIFEKLKDKVFMTEKGLVSFAPIIGEAIAELETLQQPKRCDGCWYGKTTINSVICGKNGTYKEADDYCKYYNPKGQ